MITHFNKSSCEEVKNVLNRLHSNRARVRIFYGDTVTGRAWPEENDVLGYVGRSTGQHKIPLLINNSRSMGGGGILDGSIVAIFSTAGSCLYKHGTFHTGEFIVSSSDVGGYEASVKLYGEVIANFKTLAKATRYVEFMTAKRFKL